MILVFSVLLILSSLGKLLDNQGFARTLADWHLIPSSLLPAAGLVIALAEFLAGLGLLAGGRRRRWGASAAVVLFAMYFTVEAVSLFRNLDIPNLGLFGIYLPMRLTWAHLLETAVVLALAVVLRRLQNRRASDRGEAEAPVRWAARR